KYISIVIFTFIFGMILNEIISYGILFGFWLDLKGGYPVYFMHHVFYSVLLSFTVMALIYRFMIEKNLFLKVVEVIFILTMFGNLVISGGRTGQLTLIGTFILTFLFFIKISIKRVFLILLIPTIVFSLSYFTYSKFQERIDMFADDTKVALVSHEYTSSFGNRLFGYVITAKMFEVQEIQNILFGFGIDNVQNEKKDLIAKWFPKTPNIQGEYIQFHSSYVDVIWWSGLIGFFLMLSFLISIIRVKIQDQNVNFLKISLFFTVLFSSLADSIMDNQYTLLLMAMFVGLVLAQNKYEEVKNVR
ncbi:MAG: O-antigen ligase family protein, partial [Campylobacterales bacterium]|nr:O-antigen ligase family protein [Campylobacterales bacterium]